MSLMENNLFVHFCWVLLKYFLSWKVKNCLRSVQDKSIISFHETYVASSLFLNKLLCKQVRQQVFHFNICPFEDDRVVCSKRNWWEILQVWNPNERWTKYFRTRNHLLHDKPQKIVNYFIDIVQLLCTVYLVNIIIFIIRIQGKAWLGNVCINT